MTNIDGTRFKEIHLGPPLTEETKQKAETFVRRQGYDATQTHDLLDMLGLLEEELDEAG